MKYLLMLFLVWHFEQYSGWTSLGNDWMITRANELSAKGIKVIIPYPATYFYPASIVWAEEVKEAK